MKKLISIFILISVCTAYLPAFAEDYFQVVVHPTNEVSTLERKALTEIFLKKKSYWPNGRPIIVVDLSSGSSVRMNFSEKVLGRPVSAVRNYWQQILFSGRGVPPAELKNDQQVLDFIATHDEAIGYVSTSAEIGNLKTVKIK
jgi:ABC-type phosphate transport system substrate-binding protein